MSPRMLADLLAAEPLVPSIENASLAMLSVYPSVDIMVVQCWF